MQRLTRVEQRARTRQLLLDAAESVFLRHGFHATSVDEVAHEAGFSKGAVYSNFESKDELFLSLIERNLDSRGLAIGDEIEDSRPLAEQAAEAGSRFFDVFLADPSWGLLLMEYATHAARHPELRDLFAVRSRQMRGDMTKLIDEHMSALNLATSIPTDQLATILFSLGNGLILEKLIDPVGVADDTFGSALGLLLAGIIAGGDGGAPAATDTIDLDVASLSG